MRSATETYASIISNPRGWIIGLEKSLNKIAQKQNVFLDDADKIYSSVPFEHLGRGVSTGYNIKMQDKIYPIYLVLSCDKNWAEPVFFLVVDGSPIPFQN